MKKTKKKTKHISNAVRFYISIFILLIIFVLAVFVPTMVLRKGPEFQPTNKCELYPDLEGCVCDEYEIIEETKINKTLINESCFQKDGSLFCFQMSGEYEMIELEGHVLKNMNNKSFLYKEKSTRCIKAHLPPEPIKIDLEEEKCIEWVEDFIMVEDIGMSCENLKRSKDISVPSAGSFYDKFCCVKKEKKTECEKGNPDWINAPEWLVFKDGSFMRGCPQTSFCRMKTIYDQDCEKLHEAIHKQLNYCDYNNRFSGEPGVFCLTGWLSYRKIYDIALEKGCDI